METIGQQFQDWTVVGTTVIERAGKKRTALLVKCKCGNVRTREPDRLRKGRTKRCEECRRALPQKPKRLKLPPKLAAVNRDYSNYQRSARYKGIEFSLGRDEFESLIFKVCHYCGSSPSRRLRSNREDIFANGIDRIDSNKGYIDSNVRTACWKCNSAKKEMSDIEFREWLDRIYGHWKA